MRNDASKESNGAIRRLSTLALSMIFMVFAVAGGLGATIRLSGAVIASGSLAVSSYVKPIQHVKGGTVAEVPVVDGQHVTAGQVLIRLDGTQVSANLAIFQKRLDGLQAKIARLIAERDDRQAITFPPDLLARRGNDMVAAILTGEQRLFDDRRALRESRKAQLGEKLQQLNQEIQGLVAQENAGRTEAAIIAKELDSLGRLSASGSIPAVNLYSIQQDAARAAGSIGNLAAQIAQAHEKIAETRLQIIQIDDDRANEVSDQLRQAQTDEGQCTEQLVAAQDELRHIDIRAPQAGVVDQLSVHAPGAVVKPGDTILRVVPDEDTLVAELQVQPRDIDQIALGQAVRVRVTAFNQRTTPELDGKVSQISADLVTDQRSGQKYYAVRAQIPASEWRRLATLTPVSGMPVEAFLQTASRTFLAYLTKPIADQMRHAFKED